MPDPGVVLALCAAALLAGWVDAVSGGGGLLQLPALLVLLPNASPAQVLATNKLSSIFGTAVAAETYRRRVHPDLRIALPMAAAALLGAVAGAACASLLPRAVFRPVVLVLLVAVGSYTLARPAVGREQVPRFGGRRHVATAVAAAAAIGFYDGIFAAGTGTFLVFALVGLLGYSFLQASAKARIVNLATNLGALLVFVPQGAPLYGSASRWPPATSPAAGSGRTPRSGEAAASCARCSSSSSPASSCGSRTTCSPGADPTAPRRGLVAENTSNRRVSVAGNRKQRRCCAAAPNVPIVRSRWRSPPFGRREHYMPAYNQASFGKGGMESAKDGYGFRTTHRVTGSRTCCCERKARQCAGSPLRRRPWHSRLRCCW